MNERTQWGCFFMLVSHIYATGPATMINLIMQGVHLVMALLFMWLGVRQP